MIKRTKTMLCYELNICIYINSIIIIFIYLKKKKFIYNNKNTNIIYLSL